MLAEALVFIAQAQGRHGRQDRQDQGLPGFCKMENGGLAYQNSAVGSLEANQSHYRLYNIEGLQLVFSPKTHQHRPRAFQGSEGLEHS